MTKSAIDLAAEALRLAKTAIVARLSGNAAINAIDEALAALTAEPAPGMTDLMVPPETIGPYLDEQSSVPPDRERVASDLTNFSNGAARRALACQDHEAGQKEWFLGLRDRLRKAATLLRQPVAAEVEATI